MQPLRHSIALAALAFCAGAQAQISDDVVKIGILTDMAGPYSGMGARARWWRPGWPSTTASRPNARA